ncbi:hypothetical protein [Nonomuraea typhae]|uniref:Uncharacterized protein n=1 Tax=Nonomuraea typhae TaxID=2603600 RepID=A0ABW7YJC4_9ACTN
MGDKVTVIESDEYRAAADELVADPILQDMLVGLRDVPDEEVMHTDGTPRHEFMGAANEQYRQRGGQHGQFLGSVAQAIIKIRRERGRCHLPAYLEPYLTFIDQGDRLKLLLDDEKLSLSDVRSQHPAGWAQVELLRRLQEAGKLK